MRRPPGKALVSRAAWRRAAHTLRFERRAGARDRDSGAARGARQTGFAVHSARRRACRRPARLKRRLTIGMFTDSYRPEINGVVTSIVGTVGSLRRRGHRVIVVAPAHDSVADRDPDVFRFRSAPFPFYQQIRMAFPLPAKLLLSLPQMPFDVIHTHSLFFVGCLGAFLAQQRGIPLIFTYHTRWTEYAHYLPWSQSLTK